MTAEHRFRNGPDREIRVWVSATLETRGHEPLPSETTREGDAADDAFRVKCGACPVEVEFDWRHPEKGIEAARAAPACTGASQRR